jgi:hypothetical protein
MCNLPPKLPPDISELAWSPPYALPGLVTQLGHYADQTQDPTVHDLALLVAYRMVGCATKKNIADQQQLGSQHMQNLAGRLQQSVVR